MKGARTDLTVSSVDRENHTIHLVVNGCLVTAICAPDDNMNIYEELKTILIGSVIKTPEKSI